MNLYKSGKTALEISREYNISKVSVQADGNELLNNAGKISAQIAEQYAFCEFEKYRIIQDRLFESDYDMFIAQMNRLEEKALKHSGTLNDFEEFQSNN